MKIAIFTSIVCFASLGFASEEWTGFKPADEVNIAASDFIANSVVLINTVDGDGEGDPDSVEIVDIEKIKPITNQKKLSASNTPTKPQPNLRNIQIETCRKQNLRFCPLAKRHSISTGFFEQGKRLNLCRHPFHNWLVKASEANDNRPIDTLSPPMIIYSKEMKVLYNSALVDANELFKFTILNMDPRVNIIRIGETNLSDKLWFNYTMSDVAQLETTYDVVAPQPVDWETDLSKVPKNSRTYLAGYPSKTNFYSKGVGDTQGGRLVVSSGNVLGTNSKEKGVQASNITNYGSSGSPMILENGKIIGANCFSNFSNLQQPKVYTLVLDKDILAEVWSALKY